MPTLRSQALFLLLAISFAAFPWEYVDPVVLAAASHADCDSDHLNHDHGDHNDAEDPCGDACGCLCCPGHGQFPSAPVVLPGAPIEAATTIHAPTRAHLRGRAPPNDIFRPPRRA